MEQSPEKTKKVERSNEMPEEWQILREKILENFESKTDGLDIGRVKDFMKEQNLPIKDFIFLDNENKKEVSDFLIKTIPKFGEKLADFLRKEDTGAFYVPCLDIIFAKRNSVLEEINGTETTEGELIHELGHAGNDYDIFNQKNSGISRGRTGFLVRNCSDQKYRGKFLEEGFADLLRGKYMEQNLALPVKEKIEERVRTFLDKAKKTIRVPSSHTEHFDVGIKYATLSENGSIYLSSSAIAATALEMLIAHRPQLEEILCRARNDLDYLREIPKILNEIKPGLYEEIQKCDYSDEEIARVQNIIKEAIKNLA